MIGYFKASAIALASGTILATAASGVAGASAGTSPATPASSAANPARAINVLANFKGFSSTAKVYSGDIARVRIRFDAGMRVDPRILRKRQIYAGLQFNGPDHWDGAVRIGSRTSSRRATLRPVSDPASPDAPAPSGLRASLTTGSRPVLVVSGFPPGVTDVELGTVGAGTAATRMTARCRHGLLTVRNSILVTLRTGRHLEGPSKATRLACRAR